MTSITTATRAKRGPNLKKRERTRSRLLIATQQLLLEQPAESITIHQITDCAEVALGTFYNYFESKSEVMDACMDVLLASISHSLTSQLEKADTPTNAIAISIDGIGQQLLASPELGYLVFESGLPLNRFIKQIEQMTGKYITQGITDGLFHSSPTRVIISLVGGAVSNVIQDVYRSQLPMPALNECIFEILRSLGIDEDMANQASYPDIEVNQPVEIPVNTLEFN